MNAVNKLFYSDLTLREIKSDTNTSIRDIINCWKETFGDEEYKKRVKRVLSTRAKVRWDKRDKQSQLYTTNKRKEGHLKLQQTSIKKMNLLSERILNGQKTIKDVLNVKTFDTIDDSPEHIQCQLCGYIAKNLYAHLLYTHSITQKAYNFIFPQLSTICESSIKKQSISLSKNFKNKRLTVNTEDYDAAKEFEIRRYKRQSFRIARQRDKVCQYCHSSTRQTDVHHIIPRRLFHRYDLVQHDPKNLILLCNECHSTIGQECDILCLNVFSDFYKLAYPDTYEQVIKDMKLNKLMIPRKKSGRQGYDLGKAEILKYADDKGVVDLTKLQINTPLGIAPLEKLRTFCQTQNIAFIANSIDIKTKICPACNWSGAFKFTNHIFDTNDSAHQQLLDTIKQLYLNGNSCKKIANVYSECNFTKVIVREIVKRLGVIKQVNLVDRKCPICDWQGLYFLKHLVDTNDEQHIEFKDKVERMYFKRQKSTTLVSKKLDCDKKFVYAYIKYLKEKA